MTRRQAVGWLILVTFLWGTSFVLVKEALQLASPLVFLTLRFALGALVLAGSLRGLTRAELRAGLVLGVLFWGGFVFQTVGLTYTTPSRSAFITGLSSPLTPLVVLAVSRSAPRWATVAGLALATGGMYLLTAPDGADGINPGDLLTLGCAVLFAGQITAAAHYTRRFDVGKLIGVELGATALLSAAAMPLLETPRLTVNATLVGLILILALTGVWSFALQLRAQRVVTASHAALIFLLEPVFAALTSFLVLGERLTPVQWAGGALILLAMALPALEWEGRLPPKLSP